MPHSFINPRTWTIHYQRAEMAFLVPTHQGSKYLYQIVTDANWVSPEPEEQPNVKDSMVSAWDSLTFCRKLG